MKKKEKKQKTCTDYTIHVEALKKISEAMTSDFYIEDVLKLIVTVTASVMKSKICSLMLIDKEKGELVIKATQSISDAYNKKPNIKIGDGIVGKVALTGKSLQVRDVKKDKTYINKVIAGREGLCSLLCVPLILKKSVIGVLNCYTSNPYVFSDADSTLIQAVANQAAIVIENARLLIESNLIREELETKKAVEKAKSILMKNLAINEEQAFRRIQKHSMDTRKPLRDIAESIITSYSLTQPIRD